MTTSLAPSRFMRELKPASTARAHAQFLAKKHPRFHLKHPSGQYLHLSGTKLTSVKAEAYIGFASQARCIQKSISLAAECKAVQA